MSIITSTYTPQSSQSVFTSTPRMFLSLCVPCMFSVCSPLVLYCYVLVDHHHSHVMIGQYLFLCVLSISLYDCLCMYMSPRVHLYACHGGVCLNHMNYIDVLYTTYGGYLLHTSSIKSLLIHLSKLYTYLRV